MVNKEPAIIIGGIAEIAKAIIPMLLIFGLVHWTDAQTGTIILFVGVLVSFAEKLFIRSQVVPTEKANAQIEMAISMPKTSDLEDVKLATDKQLEKENN